jgi:hypothetical protein
LSDRQAPLRRRLLDGWIVIAARFGGVQTLVLLAFFYFILVGPVSVVQALARTDHLDKRNTWKTGSAWRDADTSGSDLERAKLQS